MIGKSLIAAAAIAAALTASLPASEAKAGVDVNIGIGVGGFYPGYGYGGVYVPGAYYEPYYGISCGQARSIVKGSGFYKITAIDCSAPSYKFVAWQGGNKYKVRVNSAGNITGVSPL